MELLFWFSTLFVLYTYIGYPIIICLQSKIASANISKQHPIEYPAVSIIIAAKNEEKNIIRRIHNLLNMEYPRDYEIIVVSDGSEDETNTLVADEMRNHANIELVAYAPSRGKAHALNRGVERATGEIIVFTDCRQVFSTNAVLELVVNFSEDVVGCVSGELFFKNEQWNEPKVEVGAYWKYEKFIRKAESSAGSVVGATGAIYAIRKKLYKPIPEKTILDDVLIPMNIVRQGYRVIYDGRAEAYDQISKDVKEEWKRKVRTLAGNWQLVSLEPALLNPMKNPIWWRFISHKIARLLVPGFLVFVFIASIHQNGIFYNSCTLLQFGFYGLFLIGAIIPSARQVPLINLIYFFLVLNLAAVAAFLKWITGGCETVWKPSTVQGEDQSR